MRRHTQSFLHQDLSAIDNMLSVSTDGYIRLPCTAIQGIPMIHLISGLDEDAPAGISDGAVLTAITGYTEWVTTTTPAITIGWDWQMDVTHNRIQLRRIGEPRSNLMLQDASQMDIGPKKTETVLKIFIDALDWQPKVQNKISTYCVAKPTLIFSCSPSELSTLPVT